MPRKVAGSSPRRWANTRPSARARRLSPRIRLTASFARLPSPIAPTWNVLGNSACRTGARRAAASRSPPMSPMPWPCLTCSLVPDTGASTKTSPRPAIRAAERGNAARIAGADADHGLAGALAQRRQQLPLDHGLDLARIEQGEHDGIAAAREVGERGGGVAPEAGEPCGPGRVDVEADDGQARREQPNGQRLAHQADADKPHEAPLAPRARMARASRRRLWHDRRSPARHCEQPQRPASTALQCIIGWCRRRTRNR